VGLKFPLNRGDVDTLLAIYETSKENDVVLLKDVIVRVRSARLVYRSLHRLKRLGLIDYYPVSAVSNYGEARRVVIVELTNNGYDMAKMLEEITKTIIELDKAN